MLCTTTSTAKSGSVRAELLRFDLLREQSTFAPSQIENGILPSRCTDIRFEKAFVVQGFLLRSGNVLNPIREDPVGIFVSYITN